MLLCPNNTVIWWIELEVLHRYKCLNDYLLYFSYTVDLLCLAWCLPFIQHFIEEEIIEMEGKTTVYWS